nr:MAG TPA: hypothetical protein [Caudoviricetes sp.]
MNVNELIVDAGTAIGYPVEQDIYEGTSEKSITFTYEDERDSLVGDDEDMYETAYLMISMNTPKDYDYFKDKEKLKKELQKRDFNVENIQSWLEEPLKGVKKTRRTIFTVNITKKVESGGEE